MRANMQPEWEGFEDEDSGCAERAPLGCAIGCLLSSLLWILGGMFLDWLLRRPTP